MITRDEVVRDDAVQSKFFFQLFLILDEVIQIFENVLEDNEKKLGSERLIILEQVFIAALDCGRIKLAEDRFRYLISEFPESLRVMKLKSMLLEALVSIKGSIIFENLVSM